jgi:hypothetical protein
VRALPISRRIVNEVTGVNRVVYDVTPKPTRIIAGELYNPGPEKPPEECIDKEDIASFCKNNN